MVGGERRGERGDRAGEGQQHEAEEAQVVGEAQGEDVAVQGLVHAFGEEVGRGQHEVQVVGAVAEAEGLGERAGGETAEQEVGVGAEQVLFPDQHGVVEQAAVQGERLRAGRGEQQRSAGQRVQRAHVRQGRRCPVAVCRGAGEDEPGQGRVGARQPRGMRYGLLAQDHRRGSHEEIPEGHLLHSPQKRPACQVVGVGSADDKRCGPNG